MARKCEVCPTTADSTQGLNRHRKHAHGLEPRVQDCQECGRTLKLSRFDVAPSGSRRRVCRECRPRTKTEAVATKQSQSRAAAIRRRFGVEQDVHDAHLVATLRAQGGRCAVCGTKDPEPYHGTLWVVDHDHTKRGPECLRGVLCQPCNIGIGHLKDDLTILRAAVAYMERHTTEETS